MQMVHVVILRSVLAQDGVVGMLKWLIQIAFVPDECEFAAGFENALKFGLCDFVIKPVKCLGGSD